MKQKIISVLIAAVMALSASACGSQQAPEPTSAPTPTATAEPTPSPTPEPTPSPTPTPEPTEEPTPEPTEEMISKAEYDQLAQEYQDYRDNAVEVNYIGNARTKKFHRKTCSSLPASHNQVSYESRQEAINDGMVPCKRCNP
ncbi:MAG: hypothetical protein J1G06_09025 [Oscillospiraceae bacterium]|nr:hypothetical protein [Oscillospiraceae bacterium]